MRPLFLLFWMVALFLGSLGPNRAVAQPAPPAPDVLAEVDPRELYLGQSLTLRVLIDGDALAVIDVSGLADFTVIPRGRVLGTRGADGETVAAYRFELTPRRTGELVVPALPVESGGARRMTAPVPVRVLARPTPPSALSGQDLLLDASLSRDAPYVGEAFVYNLRLYRAVAASGISLAPPEFPGFAVAPLPGQHDGEIEVAGRRYAVAEVQYLLTPLRVGRAVIAPPTALCRGVAPKGKAGPAKDVTVAGRGLTVTVRPVPAYVGPAAFTGLIGRLELSARLEDARSDPGSEAIYSLTLAGRGNIADYTAPELQPPNGVTARTLPAETSGAYVPTGFSGQRVFRYGLTAARPGDYLLPAVTWTVFDPEAGTYRTVSAPALTFRAAPTPAGDPKLAPPLRHGLGAPNDAPLSWPWRLVLGLTPVTIFGTIRFYRSLPFGYGQPPEKTSPVSLAEDLRQALARADPSTAAYGEGATALAQLDRLLYAGETVPPQTLDAAVDDARQSRKRFAA